MPFTEQQAKLLAGKLDGRHVRTRELDGVVLSYVEGWHVIAEANRIFGFEGWDRETLSTECVRQERNNGEHTCCYIARVRVRVHAGGCEVVRDGTGVGHGTARLIGEAHERGIKDAETDGTKRALCTFGNLFGLALYDKQQAGVRRRVGRLRAARPVRWSVLSRTDERLATYADPQEYCSALRIAIEEASEASELDGLWEKNTPALQELKASAPHLRNDAGTHFVDLLTGLHQRRREKLLIAAEAQLPGNPSAENTAEDEPEPRTIPPHPKRLRSREHLTFVAGQPCLVCGRQPAQAHHLRFAQPRALGKKVSDEFAVPLCATHHRALHDVGDEQSWWTERNIDPVAAAEWLWAMTRSQTAATEAPTRAPNSDDRQSSNLASESGTRENQAINT